MMPTVRRSNVEPCHSRAALGVPIRDERPPASTIPAELDMVQSYVLRGKRLLGLRRGGGMFREPMDVQRTLRADGVPATVAFQGGELSDTPPLPRGCRAPSYRTKRTPSCSPRFSAGPRRVLGAAQAACPVARDLPPHPRHPLLPRLLQRGR